MIERHTAKLKILIPRQIFRLYSVTCQVFSCFIADDPVVRARLSEALETVLNKTQEPSKSKKVQHSNAKNAVLFESINLILHFKG